MHTDDANGVIEGRRERKREARTGDEREREEEEREERRQENATKLTCNAGSKCDGREKRKKGGRKEPRVTGRK